jgi:acyl-CoA dehydrogenase
MVFDRRHLFTPEQEDFRLLIRDFIDREVIPFYGQWEQLGHIPREFFGKLGDIGVMGMAIPEKFGGAGDPDYRYNVILQEEASRALVTLGTTRSQLDVWLPYFLKYCTPEQQGRWFPGLAAGSLLTAVAMTEPGTGSDLAGVTTRALRDGDVYILNGSKTFITGGYLADLVIVVARTSDAPPGNRREGLSLLVVEDGMPGFVKGRKLEKIGLRVQDTAELSFSDVRVPVANLLGEEGKAFGYLGHNLPQERLTIAVGSVAQARAAVTAAQDYARSRVIFGQELASFQNTKFELAACLTEVEAAQALLDRALAELVGGTLTSADAAMVKLFTTEVQARVVDRCLQVFGGYGYILEYPIARLYADARVTRIYGGTSEVMKLIISKSMGLLHDHDTAARCLTVITFGDTEPAVLHPAAGELVVVRAVSLLVGFAAGHKARALIGGTLALAAFAGCASGTSDALAGQSGKQVLDRAVGNLETAPSFTLSGNVIQSGARYTIDLGYRPARGCTGTVAQAGKGSFVMTVIGGTAWVRPDDAFWRSVAGSQASSVISAVGGRYLKGPTSNQAVAGLTSLCDVNTLASQLQAPATVERAAVKPFAGTLAVPLTDLADGGTLYVTDAASPQVIQLRNSKSGKITFHIDAPVTLNPPPPSKTVNGSQFGF